MATPSTKSSSGAVTTFLEKTCPTEIRVGTDHNYEIITGVHSLGSVPSGLPEVSTEGRVYVFRIISGKHQPQVVITLDSKQLTEQARIRSINRAIRHKTKQ